MKFSCYIWFAQLQPAAGIAAGVPPVQKSPKFEIASRAAPKRIARPNAQDFYTVIYSTHSGAVWRRTISVGAAQLALQPSQQLKIKPTLTLFVDGVLPLNQVATEVQ